MRRKSVWGARGIGAVPHLGLAAGIEKVAAG